MNKYAKYEPCCYSFLIVCLHFLARLKTRKTAFKDLYTYPYVEYSKLCTISTYPGRLSNICCNIFKAIQLPSLTVWDPDVEGIWKRDLLLGKPRISPCERIPTSSPLECGLVTMTGTHCWWLWNKNDLSRICHQPKTCSEPFLAGSHFQSKRNAQVHGIYQSQ